MTREKKPLWFWQIILYFRSCKNGFHQWETFEMAESYKCAFPTGTQRGRNCKCCGALQYRSDDNTHWQRGARGVLIQSSPNVPDLRDDNLHYGRNS
jgi:hypothetical protein